VFLPPKPDGSSKLGQRTSRADCRNLPPVRIDESSRSLAPPSTTAGGHALEERSPRRQDANKRSRRAVTGEPLRSSQGASTPGVLASWRSLPIPAPHRRRIDVRRVEGPAVVLGGSALELHFRVSESGLRAPELWGDPRELHFRVSESGLRAPELWGDPRELHFRVSESGLRAPELWGDPPELHFRSPEAHACVSELRAPDHDLQKRACVFGERRSPGGSQEQALHLPPRG
jgi:hypothetical protein